MEEKIKMLLCEDDENLNIWRLRAILPLFALMEKQVSESSLKISLI